MKATKQNITIFATVVGALFAVAACNDGGSGSDSESQSKQALEGIGEDEGGDDYDPNQTSPPDDEGDAASDTPACDACISDLVDGCPDESAACAASDAYDALIACVDTCAESDPEAHRACVAACEVQSPDGAALASALEGCLARAFENTCLEICEAELAR